MDVPGVYSYIVEKIIEGKKSGSVRIAEYCTLASTRGAIPKVDEDYAIELKSHLWRRKDSNYNG
ncbi:MAG: hypothetical protein QXD78_06080 [Candidatus Bathyarchaeia archaeon]